MMINGTVSNIGETKGFYRVQVDGDRRWFGMGRNRPNFVLGDVVSFSTRQSEKGFWEVEGRVDLVTNGPKVTTVPYEQIVTSPTTATTRTVSSGTDWAKKDKIIQKQSCRNSAIEVVRILLDKECLKLPAEKKRYDFVLALVDDLTEKYELANDGKTKDMEVLESDLATEPEAPASETWA